MLDTHLLLWAVSEPERLPHEARAIIDDKKNRILFSVASIWEITIKTGRGRDDFKVDPARIRNKLLFVGFSEVVVEAGHVLAVLKLDSIHKDPFDRLLIAQSDVEECLLLTSDDKVRQYPGRIRHV